MKKSPLGIARKTIKILTSTGIMTSTTLTSPIITSINANITANTIVKTSITAMNIADGEADLFQICSVRISEGEGYNGMFAY